jgi:hypothetical protein
MTALARIVSAKGRFARSVNIERDAGRSTLEGYIPTGRALDVIGRVGRSLEGAEGRSFSITGPYGTGKSSLAVFLDALFGPSAAEATATADTILASVDPNTAEAIRSGRTAMAGDDGFIRAVVTASREPISATIVRALAHGAKRFSPGRRRAVQGASLRDLERAISDLEDRDRPLPTTRFIRQIVQDLSARAPILLVIDEFGKNLEAFGDSRSDADLYLLQELVEWAHAPGEQRLPLITVTMQHLAFEEYLDTASQALRREWAKVQGRFEDVPYVDTPRQMRHLIAQVHEHSDAAAYQRKVSDWAARVGQGLRDAGLGHEIDDELLRSAYPLHPAVLLVLPDLCARYGQNERTLFSFLASGEPAAVPAWLRETTVGAQLTDVRLDRVYDYFVESAATMTGASQSASRWVEVETAIRDASNLTPAERRVLKAIGLINLISAGGSVRASRRVVAWACADGQPGTESIRKIQGVLDSLETAGRITYREFADEFRLWRGSDLDLKAALESARRRLREQSLENLLGHARTMLPVVAARHSTKTGTLRAFERVWDADGRVTPLTSQEPADGLLVYVVGDGLPSVAAAGMRAKPVIAVRPATTASLIDCAVELGSIRAVLADTETIGDDWVARRELTEREAEALTRFDMVFEKTVGHRADGAEWWLLGPDQVPERLPESFSVTATLSSVCDRLYSEAPDVRNEMLNRHDLTSQGAKARRLLVEGLLLRLQQPRLGIDGFPPEGAMYDAVLGASGIHRSADGGFEIGKPAAGSNWTPAWTAMTSMLDRAKDHRVGFDRMIEELASPPVGMKAGTIPVLLIAGILAYRNEVAVYEHGTYRPRLTPEVAERLLRNPGHFQIKHFAATRGPRREVVDALSDALGGSGGWRNSGATVLTVVSHLVGAANGLTEYARRTKLLSEQAQRIRRALLDATEPDVLLFQSLPAAVGAEPVPVRRSKASYETAAYVAALTDALSEITRAYSCLLDDVVTALRESTSTVAEDYRTELGVRARQLSGSVLDPRLKGLVAALTSYDKTDQEWAEHVAMAVLGPPPSAWNDEDRSRFLALVMELGGTLRRLEALHFDQRAHDERIFNALRVTITRTSGLEEARVIAITDAQRKALGRALAEFLHQAEVLAGHMIGGRELALGLLADELLPESLPDTIQRPPTKAQTKAG